jgi:hypothetical protein
LSWCTKTDGRVPLSGDCPGMALTPRIFPLSFRLTRASCEGRARDLSSDLNYQDTGPLKPSPSTQQLNSKEFHFALCRPVTHARPECGCLSRGEPCIQARLFTSACCQTPASSRQMHEVPSFTARMGTMHAHGCLGDVFPLSQFCTLNNVWLSSPTLRHAARHAPPSLSRARPAPSPVHNSVRVRSSKRPLVPWWPSRSTHKVLSPK